MIIPNYNLEVTRKQKIIEIILAVVVSLEGLVWCISLVL